MKRKRKPTAKLLEEPCSDNDCTTCLHLPTLDELESGAVLLLEEPASETPAAIAEVRS